MSTVDYLPDDEKLEMLQGTLEVLILRSLRPEPNHAYGISLFLKQQSDSEFLVDNGSLYPALQRLLQRKWIAGQWKTSPNGRRARYYSLTLRGGRNFSEQHRSGNGSRSRWRRFSHRRDEAMRPWWSKIEQAFGRRRRLASELEQEMEAHLQFLIDENLERGMSPEAGAGCGTTRVWQ